jgi:hypothetical protein
MIRESFRVIGREVVAFTPLESVSVIPRVLEKAVSAVVPEIIPLGIATGNDEVEGVNPEGRLPLVSAQVYGPTPPTPCKASLYAIDGKI